ncbi:MAG TPA: NAD-dependent epimerase/dehydratase family protein [Tepidisphaeraceae bacterium]|jgi:UDP-glucose 4-epimerase|nr:NAD-dependent epimerase/dehydratase family protein [Tepidisphaeraceae bacterium]
MGKRVLITGGAGFIGSHLCQRLLSDGCSVVALDDLSTGFFKNIADLVGRADFQFVRGSVEDEATVNILMSQCDTVFHLASAVGVQLIVDEPVRTIRTTIHGTEVVLEAANRYGRPTLITSSSEVYGKGARVPFSEDDDVVMGATRQSRWCYAYSKGIDEFLGLAYNKQYGLPVRIVRLFNTVGPRQVGMYGMVLPRFVQAAIKNAPLKVFGDGTQTRCFCHVTDVVDAIVRLAATAESVGNVFNLGSDEEISINDLAQRVIQLAGSSSKIEHITYEEAYGQKFDDMARRVPKLDKIRSAIAFSPRFNLTEIIKSVIEEKRAVNC